jgi:hypothetical protein
VIGQVDPVDGAMFIAKPYDPYNVGRMLQYLVVATRSREGAFA